jgi:hypothetical protein
MGKGRGVCRVWVGKPKGNSVAAFSHVLAWNHLSKPSPKYDVSLRFNLILPSHLQTGLSTLLFLYALR